MSWEYRGQIREIKYPLKSILPTLASGGRLNARRVENVRIKFHSGGERSDQWSAYGGQYHSATLPELSSNKYRMHVEQVFEQSRIAGRYRYTRLLFRSRNLPASGLDKYIAYFRILSDADVKLLEALCGASMSRKFANRDIWDMLEPVVTQSDFGGIRLELQKVEIDSNSVTIKLKVPGAPSPNIKAVFDFDPSRRYDFATFLDIEVEKFKVVGIGLASEMRRRLERKLMSAIGGLLSPFHESLEKLNIHSAYFAPTVTLCSIDEKRNGVVLRPVFGLLRM